MPTNNIPNYVSKIFFSMQYTIKLLWTNCLSETFLSFTYAAQTSRIPDKKNSRLPPTPHISPNFRNFPRIRNNKFRLGRLANKRTHSGEIGRARAGGPNYCS